MGQMSCSMPTSSYQCTAQAKTRTLSPFPSLTWKLFCVSMSISSTPSPTRTRPEQSEADSSSDSSSEEVEETTITVRVYTVTYNGEWYFADHVFALSEDQKDLADNYAENLSVFLSDGSYQVLSDTEFSAMGLSYDGVVFTDGETQVVYYNQLDERWKDEPYGTDNIGGLCVRSHRYVDRSLQPDVRHC